MTCYNKHYDIRHVLHVCFFFLLASLLVHENIETEILPNIKNMISLNCLSKIGVCNYF